VTIALMTVAALGLIPLAGFVESAVEELAELLGQFVGGLLHTTFGNVAELTIALSILLASVGAGGSALVLGSIAGVIIRNALLFLGLSTLLGCARNGRMRFNAENASEYSTVFALAVVGLCLPTIGSLIFGLKPGEARTPFEEHRLILLSAALAVVLLVSYLAYVFFAVFRIGEGYNLVEQRIRRRAEKAAARLLKRQVRLQLRGGGSGNVQQRELLSPALPDTQALFRQERDEAERRLGTASVAVAAAERKPAGEPGGGDRKRIYARAALAEHRRQMRDERGDEGFLAGHRIWRGIIAVAVLAAATAGVAVMSEGFAGGTEELFSNNPQFKTSYEFFLGLILIPVLAGIVEFYGSVETARNNRMEITMAVTAGATIQMILLVVPILVLVGFFTSHPLVLVFQPLNIIIFGASTVIYMLLSRDGESTWLEGVQLTSLWALVAVVALFLPPAPA
jgi:Ca2+:H+ antiporter